MNGSVQRVTALAAGLVMAVAGCNSSGLRSWNPISQLMPKTDSYNTKLRLARVQEQQGKLRKAHAIYFELYRSNPRNVAVCQRLAIVSARLGDQQQAERFFEEALRLAPNQSDLLADYGYAKLKSQDFAAAESLLRRAVALQPANKRTINNLAMTLGYQGKDEQALTMFCRAVPEAQAHANLGYIHTQRGEGKLADVHYTRAAELDKTLRPASLALRDLAETKPQNRKTERGRKQIAKRKEAIQNRQAKRVAVAQKTESKVPVISKVRLTGAEKTPGPFVRRQPTKQVSRIPVQTPRIRSGNPFEIRQVSAKTVTLPKIIDPAFTGRQAIRRRPPHSTAVRPATGSSAPFPQNSLQRKRKPATSQSRSQRSTAPAAGWIPAQTQRTTTLPDARKTSQTSPEYTPRSTSKPLSDAWMPQSRSNDQVHQTSPTHAPRSTSKPFSDAWMPKSRSSDQVHQALPAHAPRETSKPFSDVSMPKSRSSDQVHQALPVWRSPFADNSTKTEPDIPEIVVRGPGKSWRSVRVSLTAADTLSSQENFDLRSATTRPASGRIKLQADSKFQNEQTRQQISGRVRLAPATE